MYLILYNHLQYPPRREREVHSPSLSPCTFFSCQPAFLIDSERDDWGPRRQSKGWCCLSFPRLQQVKSRPRPSDFSPCDLSLSFYPHIRSVFNIRPTGQSIFHTSYPVSPRPPSALQSEPPHMRFWRLLAPVICRKRYSRRLAVVSIPPMRPNPGRGTTRHVKLSSLHVITPEVRTARAGQHLIFFPRAEGDAVRGGKDDDVRANVFGERDDLFRGLGRIADPAGQVDNLLVREGIGDAVREEDQVRELVACGEDSHVESVASEDVGWD